MPGLDGVRAIAVMAVLLFHANPDWLPGGFLGVDVFFTLSGFLITSLLLSEIDATGGIRLGRFYQRRASRLLPALLLVLVGTSLLAMTVAQDAAARVREDALASMSYLTNWWYVAHGTSYFEATGRPPLLQHLWSLAVEEQFYLVWPLLVFLLWHLGRARAVRIGAVAGALGSTAWMAWIAAGQGMPAVADSARVYFGSDTHAMTLLVGAALATFWRQRGVVSALTRRGRLVLSRLGIVSLALLLGVFALVDPLSPGLFRGGFLAVGFLTAAVVASAAVAGTTFSRTLARQPLRWLGERSYGIYLWHWPIFMVLRPGIDLDAGVWPVLIARFGLTFLAAELSYRLIEIPVRRGALGRIRARWKELGDRGLRTRVRLVSATTAGVVLTLGVGLSSAQEPTFEDALAGVTSVGTDPVTRSPGARLPVAQSGLAPVGLAPVARAGEDARGSTTAVGDSVMIAAGKALRAEIPRLTVDASLSRQPRAVFARIRERKRLGRLGGGVVISAGTNGPIRSADLIAILTELKDRRRVILVTCHAGRSWVAQSNASIRSAARLFTKGNVRVADWQAYATSHHGSLYGDGVHPRGDGATAYADLIHAALRQ